MIKNLGVFISILAEAFIIILTYHITILAEDNPEKPHANTNSIIPQITTVDAESTDVKDTTQIEVQVKNNKTQQTSTLFVSSNERLLKELQDIKISLQQLQQTVDYLVNHVIADLEEENQRLKDLLRVYNIDPSYFLRTPGSKFVPGSPQINREKSTPTNERINIDVEKLIKKQEEQKTVLQEFYFKIIDEWGRDPEIVKQFGTSAPTVKGIVGVVPPNTPREKLEELGRELRAKYDKYDNINIEVFDDEESALAFAERNARDPEHNVLSISKHKESGRDIIIVYGTPLSSASILPSSTSETDSN